MARFHATSEGNVPFTVQEELDQDAIDLAYSSTQIDRDKQYKIQAIKDNTNLSAPVTIGLVTYNGGDSSASAIMGGINLANLNQESNMAIWDIDNYVRTYSITEAMSIVNTIALAYRSNALARQNKIMAINAITIDTQGLYPTYESAKTALDLITV